MLIFPLLHHLLLIFVYFFYSFVSASSYIHSSSQNEKNAYYDLERINLYKIVCFIGKRHANARIKCTYAQKQ